MELLSISRYLDDQTFLQKKFSFASFLAYVIKRVKLFLRPNRFTKSLCFFEHAIQAIKLLKLFIDQVRL